MMTKDNINQTTLRILSLFNDNYEKTIHTREAARQTSVDIKAVQRQLKKLEQNNIIISEIKGRNKEHRLNTHNILTKYHLELAETYATITYLKENYRIKRILEEIGEESCGINLLFGSYAKREEDEESDIDILNITDDGDSIDYTEAEKVIGREINVKTITKAQFIQGMIDKDPLITEAINNHITLKGIGEFIRLRWEHHVKR